MLINLMALFWQNWVVVPETAWLTKAKIPIVLAHHRKTWPVPALEDDTFILMTPHIRKIFLNFSFENGFKAITFF